MSFDTTKTKEKRFHGKLLRLQNGIRRNFAIRFKKIAKKILYFAYSV